MATGDLTSLANAKQWLGVAASTDDALLARLVTAASQFIQSWLNRSIPSQAYTEKRNGHGGDRLALANYPVSAISQVTVDGIGIPAAATALDTGYRFDERFVYLRGYVFTRGWLNVGLTYTAGFTTIPADLEQACIALVGLRYRERDRIGHQSKSIGGETVAFWTRDMPADVQTVLNAYRKVVPL